MHHELQYDVIIIGAGPAGNAAAADLAHAGAKVALLEKRSIPRHKTCGGGIPLTMATLLQLAEWGGIEPEDFVEARVGAMRHTYRFEEPHLSSMNPPGSVGPEMGLWMVQRSVFDAALARRAANAGAEIIDSAPVQHLDRTRDGLVAVEAEGWRASAKVVIGADGANGISAREAGLQRKRTLAIAIEAEVPHTWGDGVPELRPDVCHLEYGAVSKGYAWVFPKRDHLNVGAGVFRPRRTDGRGDAGVNKELRSAVMRYLQLLGVPQKEEALTFHAHPLPIWDGMHPVQTKDGRVLLVGDAAGLINPFFGDGILHALNSGHLAAKAILAGNPAGYEAEIEKEFRANFDGALSLAKFFYQWPGLCYHYGVARETATRTAVRLLSGELRFDDIAGRVLNHFNDILFHGRPAAEG